MLQRVDTKSTYELCKKKKKKILESFSFHLYVTGYNPFRHSSVPILWYVQGNFE